MSQRTSAPSPTSQTTTSSLRARCAAATAAPMPDAPPTTTAAVTPRTPRCTKPMTSPAISSIGRPGPGVTALMPTVVTAPRMATATSRGCSTGRRLPSRGARLEEAPHRPAVRRLDPLVDERDPGRPAEVELERAAGGGEVGEHPEVGDDRGPQPVGRRALGPRPRPRWPGRPRRGSRRTGRRGCPPCPRSSSRASPSGPRWRRRCPPSSWRRGRASANSSAAARTFSRMPAGSGRTGCDLLVRDWIRG